MAGLAAVLIYSAVLSIKPAAIATVQRTSRTSFAGMTVTFLATLLMPLQQAVMVGIVLAAVLFLYRAGTDVRVRQMRVDGDRLIVSDPPPVLPSNAVTVLGRRGEPLLRGRSHARASPARPEADTACGRRLAAAGPDGDWQHLL